MDNEILTAYNQADALFVSSFCKYVQMSRKEHKEAYRKYDEQNLSWCDVWSLNRGIHNFHITEEVKKTDFVRKTDKVDKFGNAIYKWKHSYDEVWRNITHNELVDFIKTYYPEHYHQMILSRMKFK